MGGPLDFLFGGDVTTTTTPSAIDSDKAEFAKLMRMFLMPNVMGGIKGEAMPLQKDMIENLIRQSKYYAGRMGISPGESVLKEGERIARESLTMPNKDIFEQAMRMYGMSADATAPASSTTTRKGGVMDLAPLAMLPFVL